MWWHTCPYAQGTHVCLFRDVMRLWRWCLYIEGSCPVCQRALLATLISDKALLKGFTPTGHGCWGEESSSSSPATLACRRRLSEPPSPLLRLVNTLHHHLQGRPYLTLSQHVHNCLPEHHGRTTESKVGILNPYVQHLASLEARCYR